MEEQFSDFQQFSFMVNSSPRRIVFSAGVIDGVEEAALNLFAQDILTSSEKAHINDIHIADREKCFALKIGESHCFSATVRAKNGAAIPVKVHASAILIDEDKLPAILFHVQKKTADVGEILKKMSETFRNEYEAFIHTAAHDLDSPVRKISVLVERLISKFADDSGDDSVKEYSNRIHNSVAEMKSLIDGMSVLSLCILEKGAFNSCDLSIIVQQTLHDLKPVISEKSATVDVAELPTIEGDIVQYKQLFKSLIDNAIKFGKGTIPPVIQVQSEMLGLEEQKDLSLPEEKKYYKITVSDNGIGFHPGYAERIFRPFERLNGKSQFPGSGLGLTICKRIIDNHNGLVYADSYSSGGARFTLVLPQIQYYNA